jgi:hypothetical protein
VPESPALTFCTSGLTIQVDADALRPLIEAVVRDVVERLGDDGRIGYSEVEAAAMLGVPRHTLRDCRLRNEVQAARVGKQVRYARSELIRLLTAGSVNGRE